MNILYLLCNPAIMEDLNRAFMRLLMPSHLRGDDWTDKYASELTHPVTGYGALAIPEEQYVPVHVEANGAELDYLLNIFVPDEALTQEEADTIRQQVLESVGQSISILDFIPPSWQQFVLTKDQMDAEGWFPASEEEV